jgi:hypothetical protein
MAVVIAAPIAPEVRASPLRGGFRIVCSNSLNDLVVLAVGFMPRLLILEIERLESTRVAHQRLERTLEVVVAGEPYQHTMKSTVGVAGGVGFLSPERGEQARVVTAHLFHVLGGRVRRSKFCGEHVERREHSVHASRVLRRTVGYPREPPGPHLDEPALFEYLQCFADWRTAYSKTARKLAILDEFAGVESAALYPLGQLFEHRASGGASFDLRDVAGYRNKCSISDAPAKAASAMMGPAARGVSRYCARSPRAPADC